MKQVKENKEIADVAFEVVGDVADNVHAELEKEKKFPKKKLKTLIESENFPCLEEVCDYIHSLTEQPLQIVISWHPQFGYIVEATFKEIDK